MRKLMWFAIGFTAACACGVYLVSGNWLLLLALFSAVGISVWFFRTDSAKRAAVLMLGCLVGFLCSWCFDAFYLQPLRGYDGKTLPLTLEATDYSYETDYGVAVNTKLQFDGKEYTALCYLPGKHSVAPADRITDTFRLRLTAEGGQDVPTYHRGKGIFLLAYSTDEPQLRIAEEMPLQYGAAWLRRQILTLIDSVFPEDTLAFARALLLGDSSKLSYEQDTDLKVSGIRHVIAVSGLHVSILFSLVYVFAGKRRFQTALLGIPALLLFAAVAGFSPSIVRACVMQGLMILAMVVDKEYDPPTALSAAVVLMLLVNPQTVTSVSFQLSVGCMVGIFLFSERIRQYLLHEKRLGTGKGNSVKARLTRWLAGSVAVTVSAMTVTTPLCALYFGTVSIIGILTNLLTLWVISFVFYGIMLACVLGAIWLPLGSAIGSVVSWPMRYVLLVSDLLAEVPCAAVYTDSDYICMWILICYIMLTVFALCKQKRPVLLAVGIVSCLALALVASWLEPMLDDYRVTVLDVGQGQCILIQSGRKHYMVDCGGDDGENTADLAARTLLSQGISKLDGLILTHYDADHAGGVMPLLTRISAGAIYMPDMVDDNGIPQQLMAAHSDLIQLLDRDVLVEHGDVNFSLFMAQSSKSDNESSMCVLFRVKNCDILITGDRSAAGERQLLAQAELPDLEVLVVGHHGAGSSTSPELLAATRPEYAIISVSAENKYGHPAPQVLERLRQFGCAVWRTDLNGDIIIRG